MMQPTAPQQSTGSAAGAPSLADVMSAGMAHHNAGRLAEAEAAYRTVLAARPDYPDALHLMGVIALQVNKPAVAVELISQAIRHFAGNAAYFSNLGSALRRLGRLDEALTISRQGVQIDGNFTDAWQNLANILLEREEYAEAAAALTRVVALRPDQLDPRLALARAQLLGGQEEAAVETLHQLLGMAPAHAPAYINLGVALRKLGRLEESAAAYRSALAFAPGDPGALSNLGVLMQEDGRYEQAIACYRRVLVERPDFAEGLVNLAIALRSEMRVDEAIVAARRAIVISPAQAEAHTELGFCLLLRGDVEEGFVEYEWRSRMADFPSPKRRFAAPAWTGGDPAGKTLLVHDEQGVGDTIQFARYAQMLESRGARAIVECNSQLTRLLQNMPGVSAVIGRFTPPPPHDAYVSLLSLPHLLGTTRAAIPGETPYLRAEPDQVARWAERLGGFSGLRVGLVWAGNPEFKDDRHRSPRLKAFLPLLDTPGTHFFALQKGAGREDLENCGPLPANFTDLGPDIGNFADTAAIMMNLDLVISSCTAPTHLAGALGRRAWTVLPFACDWRWYAHGDDTPWYPTMRLFRQTRRGDWDTVMGRVAAALADAAA